MERKNNQLLEASSFASLDPSVKDELPEWCTDEVAFQNYKRLIQISVDMNRDQPSIHPSVKNKLDKVFIEKNNSKWLLMSFLAIGSSANNNQKTVWMSLAAVFIIALVTTVFLFVNTSENVVNSAKLSAQSSPKKVKKEGGEREKLQVSIPSPKIHVQRPPIQLAVVEHVTSRIPESTAEIMMPSLESQSDLFVDRSWSDNTVKDEQIDKTISLKFSLADPALSGLLDMIEPSY
jgi:hypothetical protein